MSVFGFNKSSGGEAFNPIVKYDAKFGVISRMDRVQDAAGNFSNQQVVLEKEQFKALFDFDNLESGWILFDPGRPPSFVMLPMSQVRAAKRPIAELIQQPSPQHKNGLRMTIKLAQSCAGSQPIREFAGNSAAFAGSFEEPYLQYEAERAQYPGMLPAMVLERIVPVKGAHGTNYQPMWRIIGWAPRGDLIPLKREQSAASAPVSAFNGLFAPSTGSQRAAAPQQAATVQANDFA